MAAPTIPDSLLTNWTLVEETEETVFDVPMVSVTNTTRVYEDDKLREQLTAHTGEDVTWRFVFATVINLQPAVSHSGALTRLVRRQAFDAFPDQLRNRGFTDIQRTRKERRDRPDGTTVHTRRYTAACEVGETTVATTALAGVWTAADGTFGFAGGAYPVELPPAVEESVDVFSDHLEQVIMQTRV